jgi:hypothetical protein
VTPTKYIVAHSKSPIGKMFKKENKIGEGNSPSFITGSNKPFGVKTKLSINDNNDPNDNSSFTIFSKLSHRL